MLPDLSLSGLAILMFGFSMVFLALSKAKMALGTRIGIAVIGALIIPGAASLLGVFLHRIFFSPFVLVPIVVAVGVFVWYQLNRSDRC
ncbi:MAG: hypothetical protein QOJ65_645 [Fimbriimonadaceae bacterium]|jgi:hypothetical protein|nr:hypothetical protein [Fimbriimonadaceae bacterium]